MHSWNNPIVSIVSYYFFFFLNHVFWTIFFRMFSSCFFNNIFSDALIMSFQSYLFNNLFPIISYQYVFFNNFFWTIAFTTCLHPTTLESSHRGDTSCQVLPLSESISRMLFKRCGCFFGADNMVEKIWCWLTTDLQEDNKSMQNVTWITMYIFCWIVLYMMCE